MGTEMQRLFVLFLSCILFAFAAFAQAGEVRLIGHYDNIKASNSPDPHQFGYGMSLYRRTDGLVFGSFVYASGTTEGSNALLYDIELDQDKKLLTFKAKLSSGSEPSGSGFRETREIFAFKGSIAGKFVSGKLVRTDGYAPATSAKTTQIKLKRDRSKLNGTYVPGSYEEWLSQAPPPANW